MNTTPARLCLLATALAAGPASALSIAPAYGVIVCTVAGTSGQYSVRVQNTGAVPLARADVTGVRLDAGGHAAGEIGVSLTDIAPGKYETAVLARHGESAALVSIATYQSMNDQLVREEELYAGKVAHVSPGSALQYAGAAGDARLDGRLRHRATAGAENRRRRATGLPRAQRQEDGSQPAGGRTPTRVEPLNPCPGPRRR